MLSGQLYINNKDAYTTWGISLDSKALTTLMTPAGMKENLKVSSRLEDGQRIVCKPKLKERSLTLTLNLTAATEEEFFSQYESFCEELHTGLLDVKTSYQDGVVYHLEYNDCTQFTQYCRGIAKFSLKCTENDPSNRGE